jgi:hypothetical protein
VPIINGGKVIMGGLLRSNGAVQVDWVDVLSTQSTSDPDVVNGIRESMQIKMLLYSRM